MVSNNPRTPLTNAQRLAMYRDRKEESGLKSVTVWAYPEDHASIKAHVKLLTALTKIERGYK